MAAALHRMTVPIFGHGMRMLSSTLWRFAVFEFEEQISSLLSTSFEKKYHEQRGFLQLLWDQSL
jgi:hypothetical protein